MGERKEIEGKLLGGSKREMWAGGESVREGWGEGENELRKEGENVGKRKLEATEGRKRGTIHNNLKKF